ncbi:gamma-glutamyltransferase [Arcobacter roscoffensis]|uniref:Glutathione hydrolase proenzyme n=1 Tax=Arcobacter roscoffensis TaxID=2961520 RepID=A0ABY5E7M4_9BACT|nr:gamma-glutamyltransferase [Arcobacter roscoffensis]UTJ06713.1 gamma-glutamyltransferase [Arcobacter roscoffensis]
MKGVVSAGDTNSAQAGADILKQGGNAYDAALAVMLAAPLTEPLFTSLGGGGFLLGLEKGKKPELYDFFVQVPKKRVEEPEFYPIYVDFGAAVQEFHIGAGSVAIPGLVEGIYQVHKDKGTLPLSEIIKPAVKYAREGVYLSSMQASFVKLLEPIFTSTKSSMDVYGVDDKNLIDETHLFKNPAYADFLEAFAKEGSKVFYEGVVADEIEKIMKDNDGLILKEDLKNYQCIKREPIDFNYKGYEIVTNPPPSGGGILIAFTMKILEKYDLKDFRSLEYVKGMIEAFNTTSDFRREHVDEFLHDEKLKDILQNDRLIKNYCTTMHSRLNLWGNTTHLSVIDELGNAVSVTTTNGEGSGHVIPSSGIMLNNMMGEEDLNPHGWFAWEEGLRLPSMMAPTAVLKDGKPELILGSAGSNRIRSAITQTIVNNLDYGKSLHESINSPRIHFEKGSVCMEPDCSQAIRDELEKHYKLQYFDDLNVFFGGVQAVDGNLNGGCDSRRGAAVIKVD